MAVGRRLQVLSMWASTVLLECPRSMAAGFLQSGQSKESRELESSAFWTLSLKIHTINSSLLFVRSKSIPHSKGKELALTQEGKNSEAFIYHCGFTPFVNPLLLSHHHFSEVSRDITVLFLPESLLSLFFPTPPPQFASVRITHVS